MIEILFNWIIPEPASLEFLVFQKTCSTLLLEIPARHVIYYSKFNPTSGGQGCSLISISKNKKKRK
jgi:hypothetical protein